MKKRRRFAIMEKEIEEELIEWINSNRNNKTRIVFEMQDKDDGNITYKFTLGNLFDIAYNMGKQEVHNSSQP